MGAVFAGRGRGMGIDTQGLPMSFLSRGFTTCLCKVLVRHLNIAHVGVPD